MLGIGLGLHRHMGISPWTPARITTSLWLDASDETTITESGGAVSQWDDKSGNAHHATQVTGSKQPAYSADQIDFDGISQTLNINTLSLASIAYDTFVVFEFDNLSGSGFEMLFDSSGVTDGPGLIASKDNSWFQTFSRFDSTPVTLLSGTVSSGVLGIYNSHFSSGASASYLDGNLSAASATTWASVGTNPQATTIGSDAGVSRFLDGKIKEIIHFNEAISTDDRQKIEGYLAHKWGLTDNLPVGHPYKSSAP